MTTADTQPHGERRCYLRGCRRPECVEANRKYCKRYRVERHRTGRRRPDAGPYAVIARRYAAAGWSHSEMAALTGCAETVFHNLLNGTPRISATSAARIDAIPGTPQRMGTAAYVDATGTRRRGQALHRAGRTVNAMAVALGLCPDHVSRILRARNPKVHGATAAAMKALYDEWKTERGPSEVASQRAEQLGWRDPQWWDDMGDIDDPEFDPEKADRELNFHERAALRREEIIHFAWHGDSPEQIVGRLKSEVSISTVRQIVQDWRTGQKRDRRQVAA
ncbi:hypothetical protein [Streptomyces aureus]|uniref:hypothetical protein n=1 Tax=Streptomyces aureus TaxID=193461 RepID=UPI0036C07A97